jgi:hypothetical protein
MDVYGFDPVTFFTFFLTLMRISVLVFLLPFFGGDFAPPQVKACACLVLALAVWQRCLCPARPCPPTCLTLACSFSAKPSWA